MRRLVQLIFVLTTLSSVLTSCRIEFNSEEWKSWEESEAEPSLRWNMTVDLVSDYELKGMSAEQVIELLGEPENRSNNEFRYFLGHSGHGINTGSLVLILEKDTVTDYEIWEG